MSTLAASGESVAAKGTSKPPQTRHAPAKMSVTAGSRVTSSRPQTGRVGSKSSIAGKPLVRLLLLYDSLFCKNFSWNS